MEKGRGCGLGEMRDQSRKDREERDRSSPTAAHGSQVRGGAGQSQLWKREPKVERKGGPTLAVHAHGIEQAGAAELGAEQGHVELQEPSLAVVSGGQVQLTAAADSAGGGGTGLPSPALSHRQEAVHKMQLRLLDGVDEGILPRGRDRPQWALMACAQKSRDWCQRLHCSRGSKGASTSQDLLSLDNSALAGPGWPLTGGSTEKEDPTSSHRVTARR